MKKNLKDLKIIDVENTYIFSQKEKAALKNTANSNGRLEKEILIYLKIIFVFVIMIFILLIYFIIKSSIR